MAEAVDVAINQKISFGCILLIIGGALVFAASKIKGKKDAENNQ